MSLQQLRPFYLGGFLLVCLVLGGGTQKGLPTVFALELLALPLALDLALQAEDVVVRLQLGILLDHGEQRPDRGGRRGGDRALLGDGRVGDVPRPLTRHLAERRLLEGHDVPHGVDQCR